MKKLFTLMALAMCVLQGYSADYRTFTKTEIFPTTKANVESGAAWIDYGKSVQGSTKSGNIVFDKDLLSSSSVKYDGVIVKKGSTSKQLIFYVTGVKEFVAYGVTSKGTRYIEVTATPTSGTPITKKVASEPAQTAKVSIALDANEKYQIDVTGVDSTGTGADCVVPGVWFIVDPVAKLSAAGMGTFCAPSACKAPEGLSVYTAAEADNVVTLSKVADGIVPAGQGVVLSGEAGVTYAMEAATTAGTELAGNALKAAVSATTIENDNTYVLICNSQNKGQFARLENGETIPAGKAYMEIDDTRTAANYLSIAFGTETAIKAIDAAKKTVGDDAYYSLQGKKIERPQHGAYIHNGKVYVIK